MIIQDPLCTPWFPPETLPARPGVYQCQLYGLAIAFVTYFRYFNGTEWHYGSETSPILAETKACNGGLKVSAANQKPWRGLLSP